MSKDREQQEKDARQDARQQEQQRREEQRQREQSRKEEERRAEQRKKEAREIEERKEKAAKKPLTHADRIDRLEAAIAQGLGISLADIEAEDMQRAHRLAAEEAEKKARAVIEKTIAEHIKPLSEQDRMERLERIVAHNLGVHIAGVHVSE